MPLTNAELERIRTELGVHDLDVGTEPYIGVAAIFDNVIQPFLREGADTTGSTDIAANAAGGVVSITLGSATGFAAHDLVVIDVDDFEERATIRGLVSGGIAVILKKAHAPPYPVTVDGGLVVVRECLRRIREAKDKIARFNPGAGALKRVDEIEFYAPGSKTAIGSAEEMLGMWRRELSLAIGLEPMLRQKRGGGGGCIVPH